ncbi:MAG: MFS transporter, partial [Thermomicrobiales bacterium]
SSAAAVVPPNSRNQALSVYTVGGTSGFALGPLVGVALLTLFGPRGTLVMLPVVAVIAALLFREMSNVLGRVQTGRKPLSASQSGAPVPYSALARVIGTVMLRSWVFLSLLQFVPVWYDDLGYSRSVYGPLVTTVILAGAAGTLIGGALADRVGERGILLSSLTLSVPPLLFFIAFPGPWAFLAGAIFGLIADSSLSVTLVAAQRLLPGRTGVASGIILGLGFVTGGIGVPVTGRLADAVGIAPALSSLALVAVLATVVALTIPRWVFARDGAEDAMSNASESESLAHPHLQPTGPKLGD